MGSITITDLDSVTLELLKARARRDGHSVEEEAALLIREAVHQGRDSESLIARARAISALTPQGVSQTDSTLLIREDRDR